MKKWIQKAHAKKGTLSHQLGIPVEDNIPFTLLEAIVKAHAGDTLHNPTNEGKKVIKVTSLLKKRANFALNVKRIRK